MRITTFLKKMTAPVIFLFIVLICAPGALDAASTCNPSSAMLCAAVDDAADVYINGNYIAGVGSTTFTYCDIGWVCTPVCINLSAAQMTALTDSNNVIAVYDQNTNCCEMWASWSLDITCGPGTMAGQQVIVSSDNRPVQMYADDTCETVPTPNPSPTPVGGRQWYDPLYVPNGAWVAPVNETGYKYGKRLFDPSTGNLLDALSDHASMSTGCGALWFREGFNMLTPNPTPLPPNFTLQKSVTYPATGVQNTGQLTFTLHVCNTGGGTMGNPIVINDVWVPPLNGWQFQGFIYGGSNVGWSYEDPTFGLISATSGSGPPTAFTFNDGMPNNSCDDLYFVLQTWNTPIQCVTWPNSATLSYTWGPVQTVVSTVNIPDFCPTPTITPLPPVLSLLKSASPTTNIQNGTEVSFNLHFCNTGGIINTGSVTIYDDFSNSLDNWQFDGPYNGGGPPGINQWNTIYSNKTDTITIQFQNPGFTGCIDIPMTMHMTSNPVDCVWYNKATLNSYNGLPTVVSTVNMQNWCPSPTSTVTITLTSTKSPTFTSTPTRTPTPTYTNTLTPTPAQPTMAITKTANVATATFGDVITWTLTYCNIGLVPATNVSIWDTIPSQLTYVGCSGGCTHAGSLVSWTIPGPIAAGSCPAGSVTWWGQITSYPFNPFFRIPYYAAECNDREFLFVLSDRIMPVKVRADEILLE